MAKKKPWMKADYGYILNVTLVDDHILKIWFANADIVEINVDRIMPIGPYGPDVLLFNFNMNEINLVPREAIVTIPWDKIRYLTDDKYAKEMQELQRKQDQQIGVMIRKLRLVRKMKGTELAERSGVTPQTITRIERGQTDVTFATLQAILAAMNYSLKDLAEEFEKARGR